MKGGDFMKLPIAEAPIKGFLHHAYTLTIGAQYPSFYPWFHSNYIQLRCFRDFENNMSLDYLNFYNYDFVVDSFPWLSVERISRELFSHNSNSAASYIEESINLGYYVYAFLDKYYMSHRIEYQKRHFIHDHFFYGYDKEQQSFHSIGFDNKNLFNSSMISYADTNDAYNFTEPTYEWQNYIFMLKYNEDGAYDFDLELVIELLDDYLHSRNTSHRMRMYKEPMDAAFGLEVYDYLKLYFQLLLDDKVFTDVRPVHIVHEHKKCMLMRIEYLEQQGFLDKSEGFYSEYSKVESIAKYIQVNLIKYNLVKNVKIIALIMVKLEEMKKLEEVILTKLLHQLESVLITKKA